jgi:hypothetical protein
MDNPTSPADAPVSLSVKLSLWASPLNGLFLRTYATFPNYVRKNSVNRTLGSSPPHYPPSDAPLLQPSPRRADTQSVGSDLGLRGTGEEVLNTSSRRWPMQEEM